MRSSSRWSDNSVATAAQSSPPPAHPCRNGNLKKSSSNVYRMLARRELSPRSKQSPKRFWSKPSSCRFDSIGIKSDSAKDARQELHSWAETKSLLHLSSKYCPLMPPPRSTIAAAFSPEGKTFASTHGDHTVKILDCQTGKCLKVLSGHRRTPWVVRFHPLCPDILASGSLDREVRLWDAKTAECIGSRNFYRPIASIAFHAQGDILAVASGHKLYIWHYKRRGEASSPTIILKTRRSLRAVHFHPHAAPFLLTAEVNDLDSSDPSMMLATSPGYLRYPPPTIYLANSNSTSITTSGNNDQATISVPFLTWPSIGRSDRTLLSQPANVATSSNPESVRLLTYSTPSGQYELVLSPIQSPVREEETDDYLETGEIENVVSQTDVDAMETDVQIEGRSIFPFADPTYWDISFLQGWLIGQTQASQRTMHSQSGGAFEVILNSVCNPRVPGRSGPRHRSSRSLTIPTTGSDDGAALNNIQLEENQPESFTSQSEVVTSLAAAAAAELPCTVKLRIWSYDVRNSCAPLDDEQCRLTIPHAVLCSEMGAHFSPCGRFLAVCVACIMPGVDSDSGFQGQIQHDAIGASTSPTRHPISSHQVIYELRIYSLEEATYGSVLASRAIRAAHCLTSIQFSPTSEHLLLAYGRRHSSLLKSVIIDGQVTVPIYTILEIYKVSDIELVRVLSSAEDEVNVACFHPAVGGGLVYGTKEGKLRILQCDISKTVNNEGSAGPNQTLFEVPADALER